MYLVSNDMFDFAQRTGIVYLPLNAVPSEVVSQSGSASRSSEAGIEGENVTFI
jgi:hypothetical protein